MGLFAKIFLLVLSGHVVWMVFVYETRKFKAGMTNHHLNVRQSFCSLDDFKVMLRENIFKSLFIRFVAIGFVGAVIYFYVYSLNENIAHTIKDEGFDFWDFLVFWVCASMLAMSFRASEAMHGGVGLPK